MVNKPEKLSLKEIYALEYKKCAESPVYFMKHYVKIQHPLRGTIAFNLYPFQEETLQQFADNKFNIILKSRQLGISTLVAAFSLWLMIFNKDRNILIISIKQDVSKELISKVRFANDNLPSFLKVNCDEDNKLSLKFKNGSKIVAVSSSGDAGRSMAISLLILDEAAFIDDIEDIWTSAYSTLSTGGNAIVLSTPNGVGQWFHKMWVGAENKSNNFNPIRLPWTLHPERNQKWRDAQTKELGAAKAGQECDTDFLASGDNVISLEVIEFYKKNIKHDPVECRGIDKSLWIWQYPDYTQTYVVSADTSRGDGGDFQACHVINAVTLEQCAEYKGQISTKDYGNLLVTISTEYNNALLIIERENTGWAVIQQVIDRAYPGLFYASADLKYIDVQNQLTNKHYADDKKAVPGFSTNIKTRQLVIGHLEQYFREKQIKIFSSRTLTELETFIWKNGKAQAMDGYNDDLTMSLGIGLWVRDTALRLRQEGIDLMKASVGNIGRTELDTIPVYKANSMQKAQQSWQMSTSKHINGTSNIEDIKWLLS